MNIHAFQRFVLLTMELDSVNRIYCRTHSCKRSTACTSDFVFKTNYVIEPLPHPRHITIHVTDDNVHAGVYIIPAPGTGTAGKIISAINGCAP